MSGTTKNLRLKDEALSPDFNSSASGLPDTDFVRFLERMFKDSDTTRGVLAAFDTLGLPAPETEGEFMKGTEGALVFLNTYGVVLRIEKKESKYGSFDRVDDSPWILQPLGSIDAGSAMIDVCPGCDVGDADVSYYLYCQLRQENIEFWDDQPNNSGRLPVKTPMFPNGVPVVIDRLAVRRLTESVAQIPIPLAPPEESREILDDEEKFYAPLRGKLKDGLEGAAPISEFWELCQRAVREGKLIAGWASAGNVDDYEMAKTLTAQEKGNEYQKKLGATAVRKLAAAGVYLIV